MDCGTSLVKYILFFFNTIVSIIGILGIVQGVLILKSIGTIEINGQTGFPPQALMPIILITIGSIVVFISFLGCCGAIRESVCMTMGYAICMLVLLIIQLSAIALYWTNKEKFTDALGEFIDSAWEAPQDTGLFDAIQKTFHCCGRTSIVDYASAGRAPPASCCEGTCLNPLNVYGGCRSKFQNYIVDSSENAKFVGLGLVVVELIGFIFACCLANNVRNYKRRNNY